MIVYSHSETKEVKENDVDGSNRNGNSIYYDLVTSDERIIDIAMKYGYDSPDSFAKAFTRFHGVTPTAARRDNVMLKSFAPLKVKLSIEKKEAFTVIANAKTFAYEGAKEVIPQFWQEHFQEGKGAVVCGYYGINIDEKMGNDTFEYLIADPYEEGKDVPEGFITRTIPELTWAVFPCVGPMPDALQDVNTKIFTEWLLHLKSMSLQQDTVWRCTKIQPSIRTEHRMRIIIARFGFR